jgi:hypothetical protein
MRPPRGLRIQLEQVPANPAVVEISGSLAWWVLPLIRIRAAAAWVPVSLHLRRLVTLELWGQEIGRVER